MAKKLTLTQLINRLKSPSGKLLQRAYAVLSTSASDYDRRIAQEIDKYFDHILTEPPKDLDHDPTHT